MAGNYTNISFSQGRMELRNYAEEQNAHQRAEEDRQRREREQLAREKTMQSAVLSDFYEYQRLTEPWASRLLILNSGGSEAPLTGRLEVFLVGHHTESWAPAPAPGSKYKTLSYLWGEPVLSDNILIDSKRLAITKSLGAALRRLRPPTGKPPLRIWIDQICINQYDTMERSEQVRLMHEIYRYASEVLVWLGSDPDQHASRAFPLVQSLHSIFNDTLLAQLCRAQGASLDWIPANYWKSLRELTRLPWFRRVWIPQEIGTDAAAAIYWGTESIDWAVLQAGIKKLETQGWELKKKHKIDTSAVTILFRRFADPDFPETAHAIAERRSFVYQLCLSARNVATDPRDFVFSRLGHRSAWIESEQAMIIKPDYKNTVADVYHEIAIRALTTDNTLMVLNAVSDNGDARTPPLNGGPSLPTWVPRWDAGRLSSVIGYPGRYSSWPSRMNPKYGITSSSFEKRYKTLVVSGLIIDTIDRIAPKFAANCFTYESSKKDQILTAWGLCSRSPQQPFTNPNGKEKRKDKYETVKFTTQGTYQPTPTWSLLQAFLDVLAPTAGSCRVSSSFTPGAKNTSPAPKGSAATPQTQVYHAGINALAKIFPKGSSCFDHKHDPRKQLSSQAPISENSSENLAPPTPTSSTWIQSAEEYATSRRVGVTRDSGYLLLLPPTAKLGDLLVLLRGGETPYVLREQDPKLQPEDNGEEKGKGGDGGSKYMFIGETYVPGLMDGSCIAGLQQNEIKTFRIA